MTTYAPCSTTVGVGISNEGEEPKSGLLIPALIVGAGLGFGALVLVFKEKKK